MPELAPRTRLLRTSSSSCGFCVRQCDKKNHGWPEGPPDRRLLSFDLLAGPSPSRQNQFDRKENTAFRSLPRAAPFQHWPVIFGNWEVISGTRIVSSLPDSPTIRDRWKITCTIRRLLRPSGLTELGAFLVPKAVTYRRRASSGNPAAEWRSRFHGAITVLHSLFSCRFPSIPE